MSGLGPVGAVALLLVGIWAIATVNRFVRVRQHLRESWADIDVELKRRYDLIPNLVQTVRGYASHEREVLERVVELRSQAMASRGSAASQGGAETLLMLGMKDLFARVEAYPDLKADQQFRALHEQLALTEDRIAAARRFYNGNVRTLEVLRQSFPTSLIGSLMKVESGSYFELSEEAERVVPRLDL